jgi:hypothetical protein
MTANSMMTLSVDAVWQSTAVAIVALRPSGLRGGRRRRFVRPFWRSRC